MRWKNILGVVGALFFAAQVAVEASDGHWRHSFAIACLWIACAYWRTGEGLDNSYNKQQNFVSGGIFGLLGLIAQRLDDLIPPDGENTVLTLYLGAVGILLVRLMLYGQKNPALIPTDPSAKGILKFILFQPPEQVREHTRG